MTWIDLIGGGAVCAFIAWLVCVPLAMVSGTYHDDGPREQCQCPRCRKRGVHDKRVSDMAEDPDTFGPVYTRIFGEAYVAGLIRSGEARRRRSGHHD